MKEGFDWLYGMEVQDEKATYKVKSPLLDRNGLQRETYRLAVAVVKTATKLRAEKNFELASQFLRSGTAPGALVAEFKFAESDKDRVHKLSIALKEANECKYWTSLLLDSQLLSKTDAIRLLKQIDSVIGVLIIFKKKSLPR